MSLIIAAIKRAQELRLKELKRLPFFRGYDPEDKKEESRKTLIRIISIIGAGTFFSLFFIIWGNAFLSHLIPAREEKIALIESSNFREKRGGRIYSRELLKKKSPRVALEKEVFSIESFSREKERKESQTRQKLKKKRERVDLPIEIKADKEGAIFAPPDADKLEKPLTSIETAIETKREDPLVTLKSKKEKKVIVLTEAEPQNNENSFTFLSNPHPSDTLSVSTRREMPSKPLSLAMGKPKDGEYPMAIDNSAKSIEVERESDDGRPIGSEVVIHFNQGVDFQRRRENLKAIQSYQKVVQLDPTYTEAYNNLGIVYQEIGEFDKALQTYQRAIEINPRYEKTFNNLGILLLLKGHHEESIEVFQKALAINPDNVETHINLGILYKKQGKTDKAIECYQRGLSLNPLIGETHYNIGLFHEQLGNYDLAIIHYQIFIQLSSKTYPDLTSRVQRHINYLISIKKNK